MYALLINPNITAISGSETLFLVESLVVVQSITTNMIELSVEEFDEWKLNFEPFLYVNDSRKTYKRALKNSQEEINQQKDFSNDNVISRMIEINSLRQVYIDLNLDISSLNSEYENLKTQYQS